LIRLALRCRRAEAEAALAELLELAPGGVEEVNEPDGETGVVEYAIYGAAGELPDLGALRAAAGGALVEVRSEPVPNDWAERWKRFYHPLLIAGRLYVRPPWERPAERGRVVEVVIDPGRAFGTGTHPTTSMCLELLLETRARRPRALGLLGRGERRSFCDLGCGSGVLAIAAAKLGFDPVLGVDLEQAAIEESARNARLNYVEVELVQMDLRHEQVPVADVVAANLTAGLLEQIGGSWAVGGVRPDTLVASGFLTNEAAKVRQALAAAGFREKRHLTEADWGAVIAHPS
jgi:ribosomal protein L11 methyltransferase